MNIIKRINMIIGETTTTADVEINTAKGSIGIINREGTPKCPEGKRWCPVEGKCIPVDEIGKGVK